MLDWLRRKIYGSCVFPGEEACSNLGTKMYHPHKNSRPIYLCEAHLIEITTKEEEELPCTDC
jgi:hypothetical protein